MATAISESYDTYFSDGARLTIKDQTFDPPVAFGSQVPSGYNEDGEFMNGSFVSNVEALPAGDMTAQALADKLNGNFGAFPISEDDLPAALRTWTIQNGAVVFGTGTASITYVPVERPDPSINYDYKDGTYYGRDTDKKVIVRITVKDKKIVSAEVVDPADFDAANSETILAALIKDQTVKNASDGTTDDQTLKAALSVAVNKALLGDTSTYDPADPSTIFAAVPARRTILIRSRRRRSCAPSPRRSMRRNTSTVSILCSRPISTFPTPSGCRSAARAATTSPVSSTGRTIASAA